jgi:Tn3 transposase DDE domain
VVLHTALDMTAVPCKLASEGWDINPAGLAARSPYITERIKRFGEYATDGLTIPPVAFDGRLDLHRYAAGHSATAREAA